MLNNTLKNIFLMSLKKVCKIYLFNYLIIIHIIIIIINNSSSNNNKNNNSNNNNKFVYKSINFNMY